MSNNPATVPAALVAAGVGQPEVWKAEPGEYRFARSWHHTVTLLGRDLAAEVPVDLSDHATRSGLLRRLAMWCGDNGEAQAYWLTIEGPAFVLRRDGAESPLAKFYGVPGGSMPWNGHHIPAVEEVLDGSMFEALAAILIHIGEDHTIRRALGWKVDPGTLATLTDCGTDEAPVWKFSVGPMSDYNEHWFAGDAGAAAVAVIDTWLDDLAGITDPTEARTVLLRDVRCG